MLSWNLWIYSKAYNRKDLQAECQGMEISVDDIHASEEARWSRSTLFSKTVPWIWFSVLWQRSAAPAHGI